MFEFEDGVLEMILESYNRTETGFQEDVTNVREWIKTQSHFPEIMNDKAINNFLLLNKCSIERAKQNIDNYYTLLPLFPELCLHPEHPEIKKSMEISYIVTLQKMTQDMSRVFFMALREKEQIDELQPNTAVSRILHLQEIRLNEDHMLGDIYIIDMEGGNLGYILKLTPTFCHKVYTLYEKIFSSRLKGFYIINSTPLVQQVLPVLKKLMKPKLFERIHVCKGTGILHELLSKEVIPANYGGEGKSLEELNELQASKLAEYKHRFDELSKLRVDENLRPQKLENDEVLGFYGNFKQLNVD